MSWPDPLDLDTLIEHILTMYDESLPGVRAQVEQEAADIKQVFHHRRAPLNVTTIRSYVMSVMFGGIAARIGPEPSRAGHVLGMRIAGACLLYRTAKEGR